MIKKKKSFTSSISQLHSKIDAAKSQELGRSNDLKIRNTCRPSPNSKFALTSEHYRKYYYWMQAEKSASVSRDGSMDDHSTKNFGRKKRAEIKAMKKRTVSLEYKTSNQSTNNSQIQQLDNMDSDASHTSNRLKESSQQGRSKSNETSKIRFASKLHEELKTNHMFLGKINWPWYRAPTSENSKKASAIKSSYTKEIDGLYLAAHSIFIDVDEIKLVIPPDNEIYEDIIPKNSNNSEDTFYKESNNKLLKIIFENLSFGDIIIGRNLANILQKDSKNSKLKDFQRTPSVLKTSVVNHEPNLFHEFRHLYSNLLDNMVSSLSEKGECEIPLFEEWTPFWVNIEKFTMVEDLKKECFITFSIIADIKPNNYQYVSEEFTLNPSNKSSKHVFIPNDTSPIVIMKVYRKLQTIRDEDILKGKNKSKHVFGKFNSSRPPFEQYLMPYCSASTALDGKTMIQLNNFRSLIDKSSQELLDEASNKALIPSKNNRHNNIQIECTLHFSSERVSKTPSSFLMPLNFSKIIYKLSSSILIINPIEVNLMKECKNVHLSLSIFSDCKIQQIIEDPFSPKTLIKEFSFPTTLKKSKTLKLNNFVKVHLPDEISEEFYIVFFVSELKSSSGGKEILLMGCHKLWSPEYDINDELITLRLINYDKEMKFNSQFFNETTKNCLLENPKNRNFIKFQLNFMSNIHPSNHLVEKAFKSLDSNFDLLTRTKTFIKYVCYLLQTANLTTLVENFSIITNKIFSLIGLESLQKDSCLQKVLLFIVLFYLNRIENSKEEYGQNIEKITKNLLICYKKCFMQTKRSSDASSNSVFKTIVENSVSDALNIKVDGKFTIAYAIVKFYKNVQKTISDIKNHSGIELVKKLDTSEIKKIILDSKNIMDDAFIKDLFMNKIIGGCDTEQWITLAGEYLSDISFLRPEIPENKAKLIIYKYGVYLLQYWILFDETDLFFSNVNKILEKISGFLTSDKHFNYCIVFTSPILISLRYSKCLKKKKNDLDFQQILSILDYFIKALVNNLSKINPKDRMQPIVKIGFESMILFLNNLIKIGDISAGKMDEIFKKISFMMQELVGYLEKIDSSKVNKQFYPTLVLISILFCKNIVCASSSGRILKLCTLLKNIFLSIDDESSKENVALDNNAISQLKSASSITKSNTNQRLSTVKSYSKHAIDGLKSESQLFLARLSKDTQYAIILNIFHILDSNIRSTNKKNTIIHLEIIQMINFLFEQTSFFSTKAACIEMINISGDDTFLTSDKFFGTKKNPLEPKLPEDNSYLLFYPTQLYEIIISLGSANKNLQLIAMKAIFSILFNIFEQKNQLLKEMFEISLYSTILNIILEIKDNRINTSLKSIILSLKEFERKINAMEQVKPVHFKISEVISNVLDIMTNFFVFTHAKFESTILHYMISTFCRKISDYPEIKYIIIDYLSKQLTSANLLAERAMAHTHMACIIKNILEICSFTEYIEPNTIDFTTFTSNVKEETLGILWKPLIENYYQFRRPNIFIYDNLVKNMQEAGKFFRSANVKSLGIKTINTTMDVLIKLRRYDDCPEMCVKIVNEISKEFKYNYSLSKYYYITIKYEKSDQILKSFVIRADHPGGFIPNIESDLKLFGNKFDDTGHKTSSEEPVVSYVQLSKDIKENEGNSFDKNFGLEEICIQNFYYILGVEKPNDGTKMPKHKVMKIVTERSFPYKSNLIDVRHVEECSIDEISATIMSLDALINELSNNYIHCNDQQLSDEIRRITFDENNIISTSIKKLRKYSVKPNLKILTYSKILEVANIMNKIVIRLNDSNPTFVNNFRNILKQIESNLRV